MTPISELIADVVSLTEEDVLGTLQCENDRIVKLNYQYGSLEEIRETLKRWSADKEKKYEKYPCVFLILDATEQMGTPNSYGKHKVTIGIVYHTEQDYTADQRYGKVIKPILYPVYNSFVNNLLACGHFVAYDLQDIPHNKIDRVNMGKGEFLNLGEGSYDYLDGIEMNNLELTVNETFC